MSAPCQSRQFDRWPATSDLPPGTDIVPAGRHVSNLPKIELAGMATFGAKRTLIFESDHFGRLNAGELKPPE
jgi:hypothetical protein